eukprot:gnl/TRDRNA2_/TRDRNA2_75399_c1_seq1.p1 gnl/TRDRNA2_/TRDRNA2_75399_c1~~gnl/TRDRNA2_/TRDRNA2_75399_c1_seq1.p1  ORF type:complete len:368 (+),score=61.54 gnl/TRDRNA2_/TRDRNA2_75399_c1_seq1:76-1104(+)
MPPIGGHTTSLVNRSTGATHRTSQFLQSLMVLILAAAGMPVFSWLPLSVVAAILIIASIQMVSSAYIWTLIQFDRGSLRLLTAVALVCFVIDSVAGLVLGIAVAVLISSKETARGHAELSVTVDTKERDADGCPKMLTIDAIAVDASNVQLPDNAQGRLRRGASFAFQTAEKGISRRAAVSFCNLDRADGTDSGAESKHTSQIAKRGERVYTYTFLGQLSFLNGEKHVERLRTVQESEPKAVILCLQNVPWIDPDGMEALHIAMNNLQRVGVAIYIAGARPNVSKALESEDWCKEVQDQLRIFSTPKLALIAACEPDEATPTEIKSIKEEENEEDEESGKGT